MSKRKRKAVYTVSGPRRAANVIANNPGHAVAQFIRRYHLSRSPRTAATNEGGWQGIRCKFVQIW